jgi:CHAT domain-containing protein
MVPSKHTTEYDLLDYYKSCFINDLDLGDDEEEYYWDGDESVFVEKTLDTKDLVSFIFNYNNHLGGGTGHGTSYATTFDKRKNRRLNLNDIIAPEGRSFIEKYLHSLIGVDLEDSLINTCVALGSEGISFVYGRYTIFGGSSETFVVPYDKIERWLNIPYEMIKNWRMNVKLQYVDSYDYDEEYDRNRPSVEMSQELRKQNAVKWHYNSRRDEPIELEINGGYNRKNALRLMEVDPVKSAEIVKWLACEQGTSWNSQNYDELLLLSIIAKAKIYKKDNNLSAAMASLEEYLSSDDPNFPVITEDGQYGYVNALLEMSDIAQIQHDTTLLTDCHKRVLQLLPSHIQEYFSHLSRDNRSKLWNFYREWFFSDIHTAAFATKDSTLLKAAYNALLFGKGLLLNTEVAFRKHILNSGKIELYNLLIEYDRLKGKKWIYERRRDKDALNEIEGRITEIESQLIIETEYSDYLSSQSIDLSQLSNCLSENEVAIEFVDVKESFDTVYYALIMKKEYSVPIMKRVFSSSQFNTICREKRDSGELYNLVWHPLEKEISNCHTVFFSPCGKLYTIPIEYAIVDSTKGISIYDEHRIYRLSSTREIVLSRDTTYNRTISDGMSLLIGGLDYNVLSNVDKLPNETVVSSDALRGSLSRKSKVRYLPGTKEEIIGIAPYVRNLNHTNPVVLLTDSLGTEYNFRKSVNNHVFNMHIATHGYYLTDKDLSLLDQDSYFSQIGRNIRDIEEYSLVRSGLMLAGVNVALQGKKIVPDDNDGLLTTLEISTLDLNDIDLVVLSACKTGEGDVSSEGVFGLQRGFKKAGAKTLLLSLWPVDDDATKVLMIKFYEQLSNTHDKRLSLKKAQEHLRKYNNGEYSAPLYWAAFVLLDGLQ